MSLAPLLSLAIELELKPGVAPAAILVSIGFLLGFWRGMWRYQNRFDLKWVEDEQRQATGQMIDTIIPPVLWTGVLIENGRGREFFTNFTIVVSCICFFILLWFLATDRRLWGKETNWADSRMSQAKSTARAKSEGGYSQTSRLSRGSGGDRMSQASGISRQKKEPNRMTQASFTSRV